MGAQAPSEHRLAAPGDLRPGAYVFMGAELLEVRATRGHRKVVVGTREMDTFAYVQLVPVREDADPYGEDGGWKPARDVVGRARLFRAA